MDGFRLFSSAKLKKGHCRNLHTNKCCFLYIHTLNIYIYIYIYGSVRDPGWWLRNPPPCGWTGRRQGAGSGVTPRICELLLGHFEKPQERKLKTRKCAEALRWLLEPTNSIPQSSPCFDLLGFFFGYLFLTHTQVCNNG